MDGIESFKLYHPIAERRKNESLFHTKFHINASEKELEIDRVRSFKRKQ